MITVRLYVLGYEIAHVVLEGRDDIEDEFAALDLEQSATEETD